MGRGNITRRGKNSWRLKFDVGVDAAGRRQTRYVTVKGKRQDAQRELTRLLAAADAGMLPEPSKVTVSEHLRGWLEGAHGLSPKTVERYKQLADQQIVPHLGAIMLQKLRPAKVQEWHETILNSGGKDGKPLPHELSGTPTAFCIRRYNEPSRTKRLLATWLAQSRLPRSMRKRLRYSMQSRSH
jgi:hypothetical protein